jgi:acetolactate synthase-1/2/3 large subunit
MCAVTSIGAGASNTVLGLATAYSDSTSVLVITGRPPRHMRGRSVLRGWNARGQRFSADRRGGLET